MTIEPYEASQLEAIVRLSLRAWEPVFESLEAAMLPAVYRAFYHGDWRAAQQAAVEATCGEADVHVWSPSRGSKSPGSSR